MSEEFNLKEEIDKFYNNKVDNDKERSYFYVSEIGKSKKEIYDSFVNKKRNVFEARVKRILENGDCVHQRYAKTFAEMGILVASEIDAVKNDLIHGRLDFIITDKKKNYVVDVKSCSMWVFQKLDRAKYADVLQVMLYMYFTNINDGILLYENKDNQDIKTFYIKLDKKKIENILSELEKLKKDIEEKIIPTDEPIALEELGYDI